MSNNATSCKSVFNLMYYYNISLLSLNNLMTNCLNFYIFGNMSFEDHLRPPLYRAVYI